MSDGGILSTRKRAAFSPKAPCFAASEMKSSVGAAMAHKTELKNSVAILILQGEGGASVRHVQAAKESAWQMWVGLA